MVRWLLASLLLATVLAGSPVPAAADDEPRFRRTTPRAGLTESPGLVELAIPGGRAWGIESRLHRAPRHAGRVTLTLAVVDPSVREAFVRIAWYARLDRPSRQIAIDDSLPVAAGQEQTVRIDLDPPEGAQGYRIRVLGRLRQGVGASPAGAIRVGRPHIERVVTPLTQLVR